MITQPEYLDENIEIINNLINQKIAKVIYLDDDPDYYYIVSLSANELLIKLSYNINTIEFCGFTLNGMDLFYDIFQTAHKIDIEKDNQFIDTIRFVNTFLTGNNYNFNIRSFDDFKCISGFRNTIKSVGESTYDFSYIHAFVYDVDKFNFSFNYDYIIDIDDGVLYHESMVTFSNKSFSKDTFIIVNSPIMLKSEMSELLVKYGTSRLGITLDELRFKDSTLISIMTI